MGSEQDERRVGGMAIVEGVFLRGPHRWAAATRCPDGRIAVVAGDVPTWYRQWARVPFARGIVALTESLSLGVRALLWSGATQRASLGGAPPGSVHPSAVARSQLLANVLPALAIATALFFVGPAAAAHGLVPSGGVGAASVETALRIALVIAYLRVVGRIGDVRRTFQNHGAEHKVVALHEAGRAPTVDEARTQPTSHPRCGTTFFVIVVFVSALAHVGLAAFGTAPLGALLAGRAALVPVAAAVAYEVLLRVERAAPGSPQRLLLRPGLSLQSLTVVEPDDRQLEVALAALEGATVTNRAGAGDVALAFARS